MDQVDRHLGAGQTILSLAQREQVAAAPRGQMVPRPGGRLRLVSQAETGDRRREARAPGSIFSLGAPVLAEMAIGHVTLHIKDE